jgi:hypothetical protein
VKVRLLRSLAPHLTGGGVPMRLASRLFLDGDAELFAATRSALRPPRRIGRGAVLVLRGASRRELPARPLCAGSAHLASELAADPPAHHRSRERVAISEISPRGESDLLWQRDTHVGILCSRGEQH